MSELLAVFAGGALGALTRAALGEAFPVGAGWPWTTLAVNVAGAYLLGWVAVRRPGWRPWLGTGFCGALTTFSTVQVELVDLLDAGRTATAASYAAASVALGYAAVTVARRLA